MDPSVIPKSILIVGSGVFGLSTALSIAKDSKFSSTNITLVDRSRFPTPDGASIDTSRLIRADYSDPGYAQLATSARELWRGEYGAQGRYNETGLLLTSSSAQASYVNSALENIKSLEDAERTQGKTPSGFTELPDQAAIREYTMTGGYSGDQGYINHGSGWVDAEMTMRYMRSQLQATGRVRLVTSSVRRLIITEDNERVIGGELDNGTTLEAELTVVAAGAWSAALLDMRGVATASGQVLAYLELSPEEQEWLSKCPTQINMSTGMFMVPPPPLAPRPSQPAREASRHNFLKIARHGFGYANPIEIANLEPGGNDEKIVVSLPHTQPSAPYAQQSVPAEALQACRTALRQFIPSDISSLPAEAPRSLADIPDRDFAFARLCHYSDTPSGNFLISYHPKYDKTLFIATGGSGHGFKFAPVIGENIVRCLLGDCPEDFKQKWAWPSEADIAKARKETVEEGGEGWAIDGSRGGKRGMVLKDELGDRKNTSV